MGRIISKNIISGGIANLVFRNLHGRQIVQTHPGKVRQTKATKASSSEFRQCSSWARQLRTGLSSFLVELTDSYMYRRLTGQFYATLLSNTELPQGERTPLNANMKGLEGFEFNSHSPFSHYFSPKIKVVMDDQRQLHVTVPAVDPKSQMLFPRSVYDAELVVLVHATDLKKVTSVVEAFFTLPITRDVAIGQETIWTSPPFPEHHLAVVAAKLLYYSANKFTGKNYSNSKTLNPAVIVFCEGTTV